MSRQLMDNTTPPQVGAAQSKTSAVLPRGWAEVQEGLASASGLSLLLVEGRQPPALAVSNNNSICQAFQSSPAHAHLCQPDCGEAHARALSEGGAVQYRCHAGLHCFAAPLKLGTGGPLAVIGGRSFLRVADYRALAERIRAGDLTDLLSADLFANVIFASRQDLEVLASRVAHAAESFASTSAGMQAAEASQTAGADGIPAELVVEAGEAGAGHATNGHRPQEPKADEEVGPAGEVTAAPNASAETQAARPSQSGGSLEEACRRAVKTLSDDYGVRSLALLLRTDDSFYAT
ncbi:MAG TPA: PocR ligand-binding domain-containing protein, partial [Pyrinomonadaceae bacterium]